MRLVIGRGAAVVAAVATTLVLCLTGTANAWYNHGGCAKGEAVGKGGTVLNSFDFNVCQKSSDIHDVYGDFSAVAKNGLGGVIDPKGPVTCADVEGNEVGFYYPFGPGSFPPPNPGVTGLMIYAFNGGPNPADDKIGFAPVLANANSDCSLSSATVQGAKATALPLTEGFIKITDKQPAAKPDANAPFVGPTS